MNKRLARALAALVVLAAADVIVYRGYHLYYKAKERTPSLERRIALLEREQGVWPLNDLVYHELGRARFDAAVNRIGEDPAGLEPSFLESRSDFLRSLALNPFSPIAHFDFAQALQYMSALGLAQPENFVEEYKRAARLAGTDTRVFADVGRAMLSRWTALSPEDRGFTTEVVRELLKGSRNEETVDSVLALWELNVRDEAILDAVIPPDAAVYRRAAAFLGEKSLARTKRLEYLSRAEALDYAHAKGEFQTGEQLLRSFGSAEAEGRFREARTDLERIAFTQDLAGPSMIDPVEYRNLFNAVLRELALCRIDQTRKVDVAQDDLRSYLEAEESSASVARVETFLRERGLIEAGRGGVVADFGRYAVELLIDLKQSRYRQVVQAGQSLARSILHVPEDMKPSYARVLEVIGDAYQKLDYLYESNATYARAVEITGENVLILLKMRKNFERLNDPEEIRAIDKRLRSLLSAPEILPPGPVLAKGVPLSRKAVLRGESYVLKVEIGKFLPESPPYFSVKVNRRAVWDDFVSGPVFSLVFEAKPGENILEIIPLNNPVMVGKISITPESLDSK
ncbi:MAG: hypothetical protein FJY80_07615 [Candidatus Aminicenantes bacterium]|nr:hypothetical protein [Candidatus Aminicenantes bacterium]